MLFSDDEKDARDYILVNLIKNSERDWNLIWFEYVYYWNNKIKYKWMFMRVAI